MVSPQPTALRTYIYQGDPLLARVQAQLGITEDATTPDGLVTLQTVACMGACSLAPVLVVNDRTYGRMTPAKACAVLAAPRDAESQVQDLSRALGLPSL